MNNTVLIVGAGPVGLVAASLLADEGIRVVLVEASGTLPHDLRASTFHPPTLDMLERFGVVNSMIEQGLICPTWQFRDRTDGVVATFELARLAGETKHPYRLQCEQWRLGDMLHERLKGNPLVTLRIRHEGPCRAAIRRRCRDRRHEPGWVHRNAQGIIRHRVGWDRQRGPQVDGRRVRRTDHPGNLPDPLHDLRFPRGDARHRKHFLHLRPAGVVRPHPDRQRLARAFPVDPTLSDSDVTSPERAEKLLQGAVARSVPYEVKHRTAYRVHERVASSYVSGRLLIAGDAAHVNNPLGGMGLNGGIHDAYNLAEKLTAVLRGAPSTRSAAMSGSVERSRSTSSSRPRCETAPCSTRANLRRAKRITTISAASWTTPPPTRPM